MSFGENIGLSVSIEEVSGSERRSAYESVFESECTHARRECVKGRVNVCAFVHLNG